MNPNKKGGGVDKIDTTGNTNYPLIFTMKCNLTSSPNQLEAKDEENYPDRLEHSDRS